MEVARLWKWHVWRLLERSGAGGLPPFAGRPREPCRARRRALSASAAEAAPGPKPGGPRDRSQTAVNSKPEMVEAKISNARGMACLNVEVPFDSSKHQNLAHYSMNNYFTDWMYQDTGLNHDPHVGIFCACCVGKAGRVILAVASPAAVPEILAGFNPSRGTAPTQMNTPSRDDVLTRRPFPQHAV